MSPWWPLLGYYPDTLPILSSNHNAFEDRTSSALQWLDQMVGIRLVTPDSKVHGVNTGPIWGRQDPGGPHVGPMNFAIWDHNNGHQVLNRYQQKRITTNLPRSLYNYTRLNINVTVEQIKFMLWTDCTLWNIVSNKFLFNIFRNSWHISSNTMKTSTPFIICQHLRRSKVFKGVNQMVIAKGSYELCFTVY